VCVLPLRHMMLPIASAAQDARLMRSGTLPFVPADASLGSTSSVESALSAIPKPRSTTRNCSAAIALMDTTRSQGRAAMASALLFATSTKIGFQVVASASPASTSSTTSALNAL
jgi:hypothetical protein